MAFLASDENVNTGGNMSISIGTVGSTIHGLVNQNAAFYWKEAEFVFGFITPIYDT